MKINTLRIEVTTKGTKHTENISRQEKSTIFIEMHYITNFHKLTL